MTYALSLVNSGRPNILANFQSKAVNYARGTQDLGDDSSSCAPGTAGANRNERFFNFIKAFPPSCADPAGNNCDTVDFVAAGHDGGAMMASAAGQARLFIDNWSGNNSRAYDFGYPYVPHSFRRWEEEKLLIFILGVSSSAMTRTLILTLTRPAPLLTTTHTTA